VLRTKERHAPSTRLRARFGLKTLIPRQCCCNIEAQITEVIRSIEPSPEAWETHADRRGCVVSRDLKYIFTAAAFSRGVGITSA
jgi:hypothetical protein